MAGLRDMLGGMGGGGGRRFMSEKEREHLIERGRYSPPAVTVTPAPAVTTATETATPPIPVDKPSIEARGKAVTADLTAQMIRRDREADAAENRRYRRKRRITIA